jgi:hypothetical protein
MDIVKQIEDGETGAGDRPKLDVVIVDSGGIKSINILFLIPFFQRSQLRNHLQSHERESFEEV